MPRRRTRSGSSKNITTPPPSYPPPVQLLGGLLTENQKSNNSIDPSQLSSIVTDLITGQRDQFAYENFLRLLKHFCVRSARDDHLEETVYHLIQAAVTFIRANKQRFDQQKLDECYRLRHQLRTTSK